MEQPADLISLCEAHYSFLSLWPGYVREEYAGAALIGNRLIAMPFRNHVALVRCQDEDAPSLIQRANEFYSALDVPPAFQLDRATTPPNLPDLLLAQGYRKQNEEVWMLCPVVDTPAAPPPAHVTIEQLTPSSPEAWIQAYVDCFNISFGAPVRSHQGFDISFRGVLAHPAALHFIALLDGEAAGALSLFHNGEVGGVYNVGTFPAQRGRGVAHALLQNLVAVAHRLGLARLMLQTLHHGPAQPLYERVGFRTHFIRDWYLPEAPKGIWSA
jgi:ribosomal protein S18 acetylase RimI-like enzyme